MALGAYMTHRGNTPEHRCHLNSAKHIATKTNHDAQCLVKARLPCPDVGRVGQGSARAPGSHSPLRPQLQHAFPVFSHNCTRGPQAQAMSYASFFL